MTHSKSLFYLLLLTFAYTQPMQPFGFGNINTKFKKVLYRNSQKIAKYTVVGVGLYYGYHYISGLLPASAQALAAARAALTAGQASLRNGQHTILSNVQQGTTAAQTAAGLAAVGLAQGAQIQQTTHAGLVVGAETLRVATQAAQAVKGNNQLLGDIHHRVDGLGGALNSGLQAATRDRTALGQRLGQGLNALGQRVSAVEGQQGNLTDLVKQGFLGLAAMMYNSQQRQKQLLEAQRHANFFQLMKLVARKKS